MSTFYLVGGGVLDGKGGRRQEDVAIRIEGKTIAAVGRRAEIDADGATVLDIAGHTVLPGLINAHEHLSMKNVRGEYYSRHRRDAREQLLCSAHNATLLLSQGVTMVRDCGAFDRVALAVRDGVRDGLVLGPDVVTCGQVIQPGFASAGVEPNGMTVDAGDAADIRAKARELIGSGVDFVKVKIDRTDFASGERRVFTADELRGAVDAAHEAGMPAACQALVASDIDIALNGEIDSLEHGIYLHERPELGERLAARGAWFVPCYTSWAVSEKATPERREMHFASVVDAINAGVKLAVGTDLYAPDMVDELEALVRAGLSARDAITAATWHGAQISRADETTGSVEVGKRADLVVVEGDPEVDLGVLRSPKWVFKAGMVYEAASVARTVRREVVPV